MTEGEGVLLSPECLTLSEQDVADGGVNVVVDGVSAVDHQTVHELHGLGPLTPQLAGHHHLAALSAALHDEAQHTVARPGGEETDVSNDSLLV